MTTTVEPEVKWSQDQMVEVTLNEPDDFLKVRETLTRIGVASRKEKKLYQSCHILHKQGIGLYVDILANAMIRDAESNIISKPYKSAVVYAGNNCIKKSAFL